MKRETRNGLIGVGAGIGLALGAGYLLNNSAETDPNAAKQDPAATTAPPTTAPPQATLPPTLPTTSRLEATTTTDAPVNFAHPQIDTSAQTRAYPSGIVCTGELLPIEIKYFPEWGTSSLFGSIELVFPDSQFDTLADAEKIAIDNGFTAQSGWAIQDVDHWWPGGTDPQDDGAPQTYIPTDCTLDTDGTEIIFNVFLGDE